jgi:hypothetical protein
MRLLEADAAGAALAGLLGVLRGWVVRERVVRVRCVSLGVSPRGGPGMASRAGRGAPRPIA